MQGSWEYVSDGLKLSAHTTHFSFSSAFLEPARPVVSCDRLSLDAGGGALGLEDSSCIERISASLNKCSSNVDVCSCSEAAEAAAPSRPSPLISGDVKLCIAIRICKITQPPFCIHKQRIKSTLRSRQAVAKIQLLHQSHLQLAAHELQRK